MQLYNLTILYTRVQEEKETPAWDWEERSDKQQFESGEPVQYIYIVMAFTKEFETKQQVRR